MSDDKRKKTKRSTAAPVTYKESILVSKKSFHRLLTKKRKKEEMSTLKLVIQEGERRNLCGTMTTVVKDHDLTIRRRQRT